MYTLSYQAPPFRSQDSHSFQALISGASTSKACQGKGKGKGKTVVQSYAIQTIMTLLRAPLLMALVLVSSFWVYTLFDTSMSHSFISVLFTSTLGVEYEPLDSTLSVGVHLGQDYELSKCFNLVHIEISRL